MPEAIQVMVIVDHPLFRDGVTVTLNAQPDIDVIGQGRARPTRCG